MTTKECIARIVVFLADRISYGKATGDWEALSADAIEELLKRELTGKLKE